MADIISSAEEASLRSEVQKWYNDLCSITRETRGVDVYGGETETAGVIATDVPCDVAAGVNTARPTEVIGGQIEFRQTYTVSLPPGTDIRVHDRIIITSRTPNREMVVQAVMTPESWDIELNVVTSLEGEPLV